MTGATLEGSDCVSLSAMCTPELLARIHLGSFDAHMELPRSPGVSKSRSS